MTQIEIRTDYVKVRLLCLRKLAEQQRLQNSNCFSSDCKGIEIFLDILVENYFYF